MILELSVMAAVGLVNLAPGREVHDTIVTAEVRSFSLAGSSDRFVTGVIDQGETDLTVTVFDPHGTAVGTYDGRKRGPERVSFETRVAGAYRIEVRTVAAALRRAAFTIRFEADRLKTPEDDQVVEAQGLATDAKRLFGKRDGESLRQGIDRCRRALSLWRALGDRSSELASLAGVGYGLYVLNDYTASDETYRQALALSRQIGDRRTEAEVLNNIAAIAFPLGNMPEGVARLREALELWTVLRVPYGEANTRSNLGVLLWQSGALDEARRQCERALSIVRSLRDRRGEALALTNVAMVLETMGDRQRALQHLEHALPLFRDAGDPLSEGGVLVRRARIQLALGWPKASLASAQRGLLQIRRSADRLAEADALAHVGRAAAALGDRAGARADYEASLALYRTVGSRKGQSDVLHDIGSDYVASGDGESALGFLRQALVLRQTLGLRSLEAETLVRIAQAERLIGDNAGAAAHAGEALGIAELLRSGVLERELRTSYSSVIQKYYAEYIDVLVEQHRREPDAGFATQAFDAVERARARGLVELLRESWSGLPVTADPALLKRERELREQLHYWSWQLWQQADRPAGGTRDSQIRAKLEDLLIRHDDVEAEIRRADPRGEALRRPQFLPLTVIQREVLGNDTVLLEYVLGERRSFVWAADGERVRVVDLPGRAVIERLARRFHESVKSGGDGPAAKEIAEQRNREAAALARLLLEPIADALGRRRVLIVPDGALHYVPFAALPVPGRSKPLVAEHELIALPSATMLALLRRELAGRPPAPNLLAVFADPVFDRADVRVMQAKAAVPAAPGGDLTRRLSRLPHSRDEGEGILATVQSRRSLRAFDFEASRTGAIGTRLSSYRFVHFATHAIRDDEHPQLSAIVLSLIDPTGRPQNGFLRLHDIYNLHLRADLVVLSACETAVGKQMAGEGLLSVAHGFFHAGAARVMATLWKVDDEATATFMRLFYRALQSPESRPPAAALRAAQNAMRAHGRWQHPYYWAGFVLQGDW